MTATDARGIVTTQSYDNLNRPLTAAYSDATPTVTYQYDEAGVPFSRAQLTRISSSVSTTEYTEFDAIGRILGHRQITDGQTYSTSYSYNLAGTLKEEVYPSGRVVKNTFDNDGEMVDVKSKAGGQQDFHLYAGSFVYTASGLVASMRLGNGDWESAQFNSRLQIMEIGLGTSQGATNLWKLNYEYGEIDAANNLDENKNNGIIARQTINFAGLSESFVQTYKYDPLSRVIEAKEMNGTTQTWIQNIGYDRYGNRTSINQQKIGEQPVTQTPAIDPATNRIITSQGLHI